MSAEDLTRARCERADAAFLLADRFAADADEQDSVTVLRAITMKSRMSPRSIYVQILLPENRRHLRMSGVPDANVLCVAQTKSVRGGGGGGGRSWRLLPGAHPLYFVLFVIVVGAVGDC